MLLLALAVGPMVIGSTGCGSGGSKPGPAQKLAPQAKRPPAVPPVKQVAISSGQVDAAKKILLDTAGVQDSITRAHAIESMRQTDPTFFKSNILAGLDDRAGVVRLAASIAIGELKIAEAHENLLTKVDDNDPLVRVAVRFALHRLGDTTYSRGLEISARSDNRHVRGMTAMCLGMLGEQSALRVLRPMQADRDAVVRLQVAEALWRLGNAEGLENLVAGAISAYPDDQMVAFLALAQPRDTRVLEHVRAGLTADYEEVRLVAARAMGMLGKDEGYSIAITGSKNVDPRKKVLALLAFGAIGRADAIEYIEPLLTDGNADVRLSAATAVMQIVSKDEG